MNLNELASEAIAQLKECGASKCSVQSSHSSFDELVYENDSFTLLRSVDEYSLSMTAMTGNKKGTYSTNQVEGEGIKDASVKTLDITNAGQEDEANDIREGKESLSFTYGPMTTNREAMKEMIENFVAQTKERFPQIGLRSVTVKHNKGFGHFKTSDGVDIATTKGYYSFSTLFNAQEGKNSSSMNYDGFNFVDFGEDLLSNERFGKTFADTIAHLKAEKLGRSITGKAIFTPQCWNTFLSFTLDHLQSGKLISKTSRLQDKIGHKVASSIFQLESRPQDKIFANPNFLTSDGYQTENQTIFEKGVLKTYLLNLYGKNKLKGEKVTNFQSRLYMPKGTESLDDLVSGIKEGILVGRFSGGYPNANGDFSGIAKNSFLIKDGKIDKALSETMISGNIFDVLENMYATSKEVYQDGTCHIPYVASDGISIS